MSKSQKVEPPRLMRLIPVQTPFLGSPERHQPRLLRVELQPVFLETSEDHPIDPLRILPMRKADHQIVGKPHRHHLALHSPSHHLDKPFVENLVQVNVGQQG